MGMKKLLGAAAVLGVAAVALRVGLPRVLNGLGFHRHYSVPSIDLSGRRALIVTTSHDTLDATGKPTGVFASEMTVPYYTFADARMTVDIASIEGGPIPIEHSSLRWPLASAADKRFLGDPTARVKAEQSLAISAVDTADYDIVFLSGGWGAAYDFGTSAALGEKVSDAHANDAVVGGVCHGPLGLLNATEPDGSPLVHGRRITAVTDKQIGELGITHTPMHPERDLRTAGVRFEAKNRFLDLFASHVVVDGRVVTGQNQNSAAEAAHKMMELLLVAEADAAEA